MITQMNTMLSSEVWQDIQGYSGIYQVSTFRYKTAGNYIWKFNK